MKGKKTISLIVACLMFSSLAVGCAPSNKTTIGDGNFGGKGYGERHQRSHRKADFAQRGGYRQSLFNSKEKSK